MSISATPVNRTVQAWISGTTIVLTIPAPAAGNTLILRAATPSALGSCVISSISLTGVTTWVKRAQSIAIRDCEIQDAITIGGGVGTTVTVSFSTSPGSTACSVSVEEWAGIASAGPASGTSGSVATVSTPTVTPSLNQDVLVIGVARLGAALSSGPTGGWTGNTPDIRTVNGYLRVVPASGAYSTTWTQASASNWDSAIATYYGRSQMDDSEPMSMYAMAQIPADDALVEIYT